MCIQKYWQNKYLLLCITEIFLNACFYSSGTGVSWMVSLSKKAEKILLFFDPKCVSLIQANHFWFWRSGSIVLVIALPNHSHLFSGQLSAAAGYDKPGQSAGALSPLSDSLPLHHHHLRPFPPRAVSRFWLSQKWDSCFDNGYCGSHQMQEAFKINLLKILLIFFK